VVEIQCRSYCLCIEVRLHGELLVVAEICVDGDYAPTAKGRIVFAGP
jgi:hypothetical protein